MSYYSEPKPSLFLYVIKNYRPTVQDSKSPSVIITLHFTFNHFLERPLGVYCSKNLRDERPLKNDWKLPKVLMRENSATSKATAVVRMNEWLRETKTGSDKSHRQSFFNFDVFRWLIYCSRSSFDEYVLSLWSLCKKTDVTDWTTLKIWERYRCRWLARQFCLATQVT